MAIPLMDIKANYPQIKEQVFAKLHELIDKANFIGGEEVDLFEKEFAAYNGTDYCVGCSNGTDAIIVVLKALGIGPGDTVLVPANSFIATAEAVTAIGADLDFIDIEADYYTIDPSLVEIYIKNNPQKKVRAVIPVHLYGQMADMRALKTLAEKYGFYLVEDAAQAQGALFEGKGPGIWGDAATYSFYPGKNLGAFGDAGGITTNNEELAERCKMLINHGRKPGEKYSHTIPGFNKRLDTIQAAILRIKLPYLEEWNENRRVAAEIYTKALQDKVIVPKVRADALPVWYVYTIQINNRIDFIEKTKPFIATGIYYPKILSELEAYKNNNTVDFTRAKKASKNIVSLPMYPELKRDDILKITNTISDIYQ